MTNLCGIKTTGTWYKTNELLIPQRENNVMVRANVDSWQDCSALCQSWTDYCAAILYDATRSTCQWFEESDVFVAYRKLPVNSTVQPYTKMCWACKYIILYAATSGNVPLNMSV